jgi:hypothetical protein
MNAPYPIPYGQTNPAAFVADNTRNLGSLSKGIDGRVLVSVDYSQLASAVSVSSYSFRVSPGGAPSLGIDTPTGLGSSLSFYVSGGQPGVAYDLNIDVVSADNSVRVDRLTVSVDDDGDYGCSPTPPSQPAAGTVVSGDGAVVVNTAPRYFISGVAPVNPVALDCWFNTGTMALSMYVTKGAVREWVQIGTLT